MRSCYPEGVVSDVDEVVVLQQLGVDGPDHVALFLGCLRLPVQTLRRLFSLGCEEEVALRLLLHVEEEPGETGILRDGLVGELDGVHDGHAFDGQSVRVEEVLVVEAEPG